MHPREEKGPDDVDEIGWYCPVCLYLCVCVSVVCVIFHVYRRRDRWCVKKGSTIGRRSSGIHIADDTKVVESGVEYLHGKKVGRVCIIITHIGWGGNEIMLRVMKHPQYQCLQNTIFFKGNRFGVCDQVSGIRASIFDGNVALSVLIVTNNESKNIVT